MDNQADRFDLEQLAENAKRASTLLKAMANQHRLMVLCQLVKGEKNVGELERIIGLSQSALSQHLARLRRDRIVKTRRVAQTIYYSLSGEEASAIIETLYTLYADKGDAPSFEPGAEAPKARVR
ncbi:MAG: ArsR/SmtB family transcription factor [Magnetovibrionaceae bacterium]